MLDQMLMDRFRIVKQIGFGAFGETFLADDTHKRLSNQSSSQCVVKRLITQTDPAHIAITRQMFEREASKLDDLNHSGIPKLIAYFEDNGQFYLVQEFIDGHPLSDEINHTVKWSEARTRGLLREVLEILAYVHSHGSIHRDLKPSNIMRRRANDKIVLIDFGAVREVQQNQTNMAVGLASGTIAIGTLGYMPAEQTQGRPCFASDIYAVGCMAIEALTAEAPYGHGFEQDAETGEFSWRHKAQVSDDFVEYIDKMVRYDFRQRYRNAEQALTVLQTLKPLAPQPTTIIVTQPEAALPSPNESKTVEPTQVTTPQPALLSTELLVSPPDSASSSTIITASEPKSEAMASTIVTQSDVQHEASILESMKMGESNQITKPEPDLSEGDESESIFNDFLTDESKSFSTSIRSDVNSQKMKVYLLLGIAPLCFAVIVLSILARPYLFNLTFFTCFTISTYFSLAAYYFIYKLCGKTKTWWVILGAAIFTAVIVISPIYLSSLKFFNNIVPKLVLGQQEDSFINVLSKLFLSRSLMETLLKSLPIFVLWFISLRLGKKRRLLVGVSDPLDGIIIGASSAVGFALAFILNYILLLVIDIELTDSLSILGIISSDIAYSAFFGYFIGLSTIKFSLRLQILTIGYLSSALLNALMWTNYSFSNNWILAIVGLVSYALLIVAIRKVRRLPSRA
ncbi:protein kinase [Pseudanabaena galeata UHCC 0370]|uniref:non-specific serine/threonine protein kinase n=1 Tax=Pseudanabaena galeata UHCC 0370 TaxID=3110310 RepID=A0ABU5TNG7_9CYAN|nr:protein kinase [Pseudanabaena galeata]MEA5479777.1 protein kinase [Pseudanabaena galeata UHCC 0370]